MATPRALSRPPTYPHHLSDTSRVVLRVLTARSVQKVLMQLGDTDLFVQNWFQNFAADNPPLEGKRRGGGERAWCGVGGVRRARCARSSLLAHPPALSPAGDPFITKLFRERAVYKADPRTGVEHFVSPAQLAHRVLATREMMAGSVRDGGEEGGREG